MHKSLPLICVGLPALISVCAIILGRLIELGVVR